MPLRPQPNYGRVAILYQALPPPRIGGAVKKRKPGGYSDSGADIGFVLRRAGLDVLTPEPSPDPARALDWVFPDTEAGLERALGLGAETIWANTVLFDGHPLEAMIGKVAIVGQLPVAVDAFDDKQRTNILLAEHGLPVPRSALFERQTLAEDLTKCPLSPFPAMLKPVRGRGSQGVRLTPNLRELHEAAAALFERGGFGDQAIVEEFLPGEELTVTVLATGSPERSDNPARYRALRPVRRTNHRDEVMPYNGDVPVSRNSVALSAEEAQRPEVVAMVNACTIAANLVDARAPIRIDSRADQNGVFRLFDLNMKPNLTGPGRPGRDDQDCLSGIAARAEGWDYVDLLLAILASAWK